MRGTEGIQRFYNDYLEDDILYRDDGLYIGRIRIMTFDQNEIMKKYAENLAKNRTNLQVLEVGYGLGEFSNAIEKYSIKKHVIVECHPQICNLARQRFEDRDYVEVWQGFWQCYIPTIQFDTIFYDTTVLNEDAVDCLISFLDWTQIYLSKEGRVSFWYCGSRIDERLINYLKLEGIKYDVSLCQANGKQYLIFIVYKK